MPRASLPYVGSRLRNARVDAGINQTELAKAAGIQRSQVANIELGNSDPSLPTFLAMCRALRADPSAVLRPPTCEHCGDVPPPGYSCRRCGLSA